MFVDILIIILFTNFILIIVYIAQITILLVIDNFKLIKLSTLSYKLAILTIN